MKNNGVKTPREEESKVRTVISSRKEIATLEGTDLGGASGFANLEFELPD